MKYSLFHSWIRDGRIIYKLKDLDVDDIIGTICVWGGGGGRGAPRAGSTSRTLGNVMTLSGRGHDGPMLSIFLRQIFRPSCLLWDATRRKGGGDPGS